MNDKEKEIEKLKAELAEIRRTNIMLIDHIKQRKQGTQALKPTEQEITRSNADGKEVIKREVKQT